MSTLGLSFSFLSSLRILAKSSCLDTLLLWFVREPFFLMLLGMILLLLRIGTSYDEKISSFHTFLYSVMPNRKMQTVAVGLTRFYKVMPMWKGVLRLVLSDSKMVVLKQPKLTIGRHIHRCSLKVNRAKIHNRTCIRL